MLEPEERCAGRLFRQLAGAELTRLFAAVKPTYTVPPVIAVYRHPCAGKHGLSCAMQLKEEWVPSPVMVVERADDGTLTAFVKDDWVVNLNVDTWTVPQGRFGFIYRQGRCRMCGVAAMSKYGRIVDAYERPPLDSRTTS